MREIKFRRLSVDGHWWYGELNPQGEYHINLATFFANVHGGAIRPETVGQYTGLPDKNGKEIYEGDIVKPSSRFSCVHYEVYWDDRNCQFRLCARGDRQFDKTHDLRMWADEVIGNIHENPELLAKGENAT